MEWDVMYRWGEEWEKEGRKEVNCKSHSFSAFLSKPSIPTWPFHLQFQNGFPTTTTQTMHMPLLKTQPNRLLELTRHHSVVIQSTGTMTLPSLHISKSYPAFRKKLKSPFDNVFSHQNTGACHRFPTPHPRRGGRLWGLSICILNKVILKVTEGMSPWLVESSWIHTLPPQLGLSRLGAKPYSISLHNFKVLALMRYSTNTCSALVIPYFTNLI